jgi:hypothetical protein
MKNILLPETVEQYKQELHARAFPDVRIYDNPFYKKLIDWVIDNCTPVLYEQTDASEYTNFSINCNWLLRRDYTETKLGDAALLLTMYSLHEFAHMTHWLPTNMRDMTAGEYAERFTESEYIASNETEILIHYRMPELRSELFPGTKIFYDTMRAAQTPQPTMAALYDIRSVIVEGRVLDPILFPAPDDQPILERFKYYNGNRDWARGRFERIKHNFTETPQSSGLTKTEYEHVIEGYQGQLTQANYEAHMIRNVKLGFAMCGLVIPEIASFGDAQREANKLDQKVALV